MKVFDVYFAKVPYVEKELSVEDGHDERPIIFISASDDGSQVYKVTSVEHKELPQYEIKDLSVAGLDKKSYVDMTSTYIINTDNIIKQYGHLSVRDIGGLTDKSIENNTLSKKIDLTDSLKESITDDFWHLRDLKEPKYGTGNLVIDSDKIRPLTSDEVANKFAVSIEHADKGDLKTKKELIDFANRTGAEKIMFFFMPGDNYSGEYSFLYSDEDKVRDIWKKYKQYAYAMYDDRGEYHEITESLKEEYDDYDYDRLKSELESGDWTNITAGLVPSDYGIHNYGPDYSGYEDLVIDAKKVDGKYNVYFYLETQNGPVEGEEPDEDYPTYEFDTFEQLKDFINSDYHIKKITEDIDEYTLRDELENKNLFELSSLVDEFSSCTSGEECDEIKSRVSFLIRKLKIDDKLVKKLSNYFKLYLEEDIEKHETLNDKIFDVETQEMLPEVREKLLEIADNFVENVHEDELDLEVKDIVLIGSNANYNYTKDSDLDVHIIVKNKYKGDK